MAAQGYGGYGHIVSFFIEFCSGAMTLTCRTASTMFAAAVCLLMPSETA
ncbi:hypothetical protein l13_17910 [Neisseria weaveri ATCC 51223]|nr:hypothetical protein l13_17910 [Neisseria weaveri ATCC 51223]